MHSGRPTSNERHLAAKCLPVPGGPHIFTITPKVFSSRPHSLLIVCRATSRRAIFCSDSSTACAATTPSSPSYSFVLSSTDVDLTPIYLSFAVLPLLQGVYAIQQYLQAMHLVGQIQQSQALKHCILYVSTIERKFARKHSKVDIVVQPKFWRCALSIFLRAGWTRDFGTPP